MIFSAKMVATEVVWARLFRYSEVAGPRMEVGPEVESSPNPDCGEFVLIFPGHGDLGTAQSSEWDAA